MKRIYVFDNAAKMLDEIAEYTGLDKSQVASYALMDYHKLMMVIKKEKESKKGNS